MDYALDLKYFHEASSSKYIIPIIIPTEAESLQLNLNVMDDKIAEVICCNKCNIGQAISKILNILPTCEMTVENNFNLCKLGPRSTGKSHLYKDISPNSILVSGGQTTVANLFYNMGRKTMGLVGLWDVVAFDEVAGINFKDKDGIQIMKDYMASGSFARGKEEKAVSASMVFAGNINQSVDVLLKTSSLFDPFPPEMGKDTAFLDRMHCYNPGWEIPKFRLEHFTDD